MKTNAIIRIILFSIAILVLLGILAAGFTVRSFMYDNNSLVEFSIDSPEQVLPSDLDGYTSIVTADASKIRSIEIEWVSGSIIIQSDEHADSITIAETNAGNKKHQMVTKQSGNTLKIQYSADSVTFPSFGINSSISKDLVVTVPVDWSCEELDIDAAAAKLEVYSLTIKEVDFDGASGTCDFVDCNVDQFNLDSVSGDINFSGTLNVLDLDGASSSCYIHVTNVPRRINMDGMSGDLELTLPEECGFTASIDALSCDFHSDFPTTISGGSYVYGDGRCRITFNGMSGDLTILKSE